MKHSIIGVVTLVAISTTGAAHAVLLGVNPSDGVSKQGVYAYDTADVFAGGVLADNMATLLAKAVGTSFSSIDYDPVTGTLYGLGRASSTGAGATVFAWAPDGSTTTYSVLSTLGYSSNAGGDITVRNGLIAINPSDGVAKQGVYVYDTADVFAGGVLADNMATLLGDTAGTSFSSIDYDPVTGTLYGLGRTSSTGAGATIFAWAPDGTTTTYSVLSTLGYSSNAGGDITVRNGLIAINPSDGVAKQGVYVYDTADVFAGGVLADNMATLLGDTAGTSFSSIDYDPVTGTLYGLGRTSSTGAGATVFAWAPDGSTTTYSVLSTLGYSSNAGGDITAFSSAVPEPSSLVMFTSLGIFGFVAVRRRRKDV